MKEVIVHVRDNLAEAVTVPPGVKVTIRDFDIDGVEEDRLETIDGEQCIVEEERGVSEAGKKGSGPWVEWEDEMARKCGEQCIVEEERGVEEPASELVSVLEEFVKDVQLAFGDVHSGEPVSGIDQDDTIDSERMDWPDLEATYYQALHVLGRTTEVS